jgi:UDP-N-acetylmuramyl pentapeptide phosphotransferase/UDP-N-acetylglucosamine-1-phosphate transferase
LLDVPNERSSHVLPTPRGGGLGIVITTSCLFIGAPALGVVDSENVGVHALVFIGAGIVIAVLGWLDDLFTLSARVRLLLQVLIVGGALLIVGTVTQVELPMLGIMSIPFLLAYMLNVIWVVGFTNIYNFMDGIDGLAGSQAAIAGIGWAVLLLALEQKQLGLFAILLAGSSLGFLFLNRPRALIFMGDVGSTFLGFSLAMLPVLVFARLNDPRSLVAGALFVAPFALDGGFTILRRARRGENVFEAHRSHVYQRLNKLGYSHLQITALYALYASLSAGCALLYMVADSRELILIAFIIPLLVFFLFAGWTAWLERNAARRTAAAT